MTALQSRPETASFALRFSRWALMGVVVLGCISFSQSAQAGMILSSETFEMSGNLGPANQQIPSEDEQPSGELRLLDDSAIPLQSGGMGNSGTVTGASSAPAITATMAQPPKATLVARLANHWQLILPPRLPSDLLRPPRS